MNNLPSASDSNQTADPAALYRDAVRKLHQDDLEGAHQDLQNLLTHQPDHPEALAVLKLIESNQGKASNVSAPVTEIKGVREALRYSREQAVHNFVIAITEVMPKLRVMVESAMVLAAFLLIDQLLYILFVWLSADLIARIEYLQWVLDGFQTISIIVIGLYFLVDTVDGLYTQNQYKTQRASRSRDGVPIPRRK